MISLTVDEVQFSYIIYSILKGISFLHLNKVVHRDIKSENILLNLNGSVKVGDLGLSTKVESGSKSKFTLAGSRYWMAPEILRGSGYGLPVDIWSLGCVLTEMVTGTPPYYRYPPLKAIFYLSTKGRDPLKSDIEKKLSTELKKFLDKCLVFNPDKRATVSSLLETDFIQENIEKFNLEEFIKTLHTAFIVRVTEGLDYM